MHADGEVAWYEFAAIAVCCRPTSPYVGPKHGMVCAWLGDHTLQYAYVLSCSSCWQASEVALYMHAAKVVLGLPYGMGQWLLADLVWTNAGAVLVNYVTCVT